MKKYLFGIFAVVFAVGASAFTHIQSRSVDDPMLYWVTVDNSDDGLKLESEEINDRGCDGGSFVCARGYTNPQHTGNPVTIFKPQP